MKRKHLLTSVVCAALILVGCSGPEKTAEKTETASADSNYTIRMGYYNCDHMISGPVGEGAGIYKKHGLNVELTGGGKVPQAMAAAQMDAGLVGSNGIIGAIGQGSPIVITAMNHTGGSYYLVASNDINSPKDLIGQKVAFNPENNLDMIYKGHIDLDLDKSKYEIVNVGKDSDKYLAMTQGQIKAYTTCDPWASMAVYKGTGKILDAYTDDNEHICCGFVMSKDFIKNHEDLAVKLLQSYVESNKYCYLHPVETAKIFKKYYDVPYEVALMTMYNKCVKEGRTLSWEITPERVENQVKRMAELKLFDPMPKAEDCYDLTVYNKAQLPSFSEFIAKEVDPIFPLTMTYDEYKAKAEEIDGKLPAEEI